MNYRIMESVSTLSNHFLDNYPEHAKLDKVKDKSQAIGEFLEWLISNQGIRLMTYDREDDLYPREVRKSISNWLADYFDVNLVVLEEEKESMLAEVRKSRDERE